MPSGGHNKKDLTNQTFGRLTVLREDLEPTNRHARTAYWICQCECGNIVSANGYNLRSGQTKSCGCLRKDRAKARVIDLTNKKFGKLTVIERDYSFTEKPYWKCKCDCGNIVSIDGVLLRQKLTSSCGCLKKSLGELKIEEFLKQSHIKYEKQYSFADLKRTRQLRFDFAIFNKQDQLIGLIEFDGIQHFEALGGWNTPEHLLYTQENDKLKTDYCKENNIFLLRIRYDEIEILKQKIKEAFQCEFN